jgi:hypothetical protein
MGISMMTLMTSGALSPGVTLFSDMLDYRRLVR